MKILLVEPAYRNKYPPLGLMKISAYHKLCGDDVVFVKGNDKALRAIKWDRIYITTLFTFYWKKTIETIKYYYKSVDSPEKLYTGGVLSTILEEDLKNEPGLEGITIFSGLLNKQNMLGENPTIVDTITPDYSIIDMNINEYLNYEYPVLDAYITYSTRGCIRKCKFCAVPILEPVYNNRITIREQIEAVGSAFGAKRNLMLLDNNVLASNLFEEIINELIELEYLRGNKSFSIIRNEKKIKMTKFVDFNQGIDARLINETNMRLLSKIEIRPLRIAFDHADEENVKLYTNAVKLAAKYEIKTLSNYILFNYLDKPEDFYNRLQINIELNEQFKNENLNTSIWSFPMKYSPVMGENCKDRKHIGKQWNAKLIRGVQCVLNATHGVVGPKRAYFEHAFGKNLEEFLEILYMPEDFIINRKENENNGKIEWWKNCYRNFKKVEKAEFIKLISTNKFSNTQNISNKYIPIYNKYLKIKTF